MMGRTLLALTIVWAGCLPSEDLKSYSDGTSAAMGAGDPAVSPGQIVEEGAPAPTGATDGSGAATTGDGDLPPRPAVLEPGEGEAAGGSEGTGVTPMASGANAAASSEPGEGSAVSPAATDPGAAPVNPTPAVVTRVRRVRLVADSAVQSPYTSIAEFNVLDGAGQVIDRSGWVASADSEETVYVGGARAGFAIDGDATTMWHTAWFQLEPPLPPHTLEVDMGAPHDVSGFRYLARQDASVDGRIANYRFFVSVDGVEWGEPAASGTLENTTAEQEVRLP